MCTSSNAYYKHITLQPNLQHDNLSISLYFKKDYMVVGSD